MMEVDILFNKQVELKYLSRIKKLLYLLAISKDSNPNVSELAEAINTSRATVMNYLKYLEEARLVNMVYREGENFPKKPAAVMLHDPNLMYAINSPNLNQQNIMETYLVNTLWRHHTVNRLRREGTFRIDGRTDLCVCEKDRRMKLPPGTLKVVYDIEKGEKGVIPIWLFGFLY
jgi:predicted AAA+ superfamily ATPase